MPRYWILKTDPDTYPYDALERDGRTRWDGVRNPQALRYIRAMAPGDRLLVYHSGNDKAVVGEATVVGSPYPDPDAQDERLSVIDVAAAGRLVTPVTLAAIKRDRVFSDLGLVRQGRLSVIPATKAQWTRLRRLGGAD